jgi:hypothetical protein
MELNGHNVLCPCIFEIETATSPDRAHVGMYTSGLTNTEIPIYWPQAETAAISKTKVTQSWVHEKY